MIHTLQFDRRELWKDGRPYGFRYVPVGLENLAEALGCSIEYLEPIAKRCADGLPEWRSPSVEVMVLLSESVFGPATLYFGGIQADWPEKCTVNECS